MNKDRIKLFFQFLKYVMPYRKRWLAMLILSGLAALIGLINPYLAKLVVDDAIITKDISALVVLLLIGGGVFVISGLTEGLMQYLDRHIKLKVGFDINEKVFRHLQNFSFRWFQDKSTGEHLYKIDSDIERVKDLITAAPPQVLSTLPRMFFITAIVFYLDWGIALFSICLAPLVYLPPCYFSNRMRTVWKALIENSEKIYDILDETFSHILVIKASGREDDSIRRYLAKLRDRIGIEIKKLKLDIMSKFTSEGSTKLITGLIALYGSYLVIKGRLTLGGLTAIMIYLRQLASLQSLFALFYQSSVIGLVSCERIAEILNDRPEIVDSPGAQGVRFEHGGILFRDVSFGYREGEYVLRDLNFRVDGGSHIALVGPSGCGKTTTALLLLRLYDPWKGGILIDGRGIRDMKTSSLKEQIGIVLQEPLLWNDSIANNIRYLRPAATRREIIEAAKMAGVDEFTESLPLGYDTVVGENACKISEGQKQKIAIARVLIKRPKILILDEAMSSMDSASEERILSNIKLELPGLTFITISHRLSTVMNADMVYYLARPDNMVISRAERSFENKEICQLFAEQNGLASIQAAGYL